MPKPRKNSAIWFVLAVLVLSPASAQKIPASRAELSASYAPVAQAVIPSVVNVYARRLARPRGGLFDDPFFRQFFGDNFTRRAPERRQQSLGSGVIIDGSGLVVTNHHVVEGGEDLTIILSDRREFKADIAVADARTDLAVLKLRAPPADLPSLVLRNSDDIRVGDIVLAIGNPFGVGQTVTGGIVSALARSQIGVSDYQSFIQTDAAINPGNSGGALVTLDGKLLGVNTAIFTRSGGSVGIGFAIPSNMVAQVVRAAKSGGKVTRPWMGADVQDVSGNIAKAVGLARPIGAVIVALHGESPLRQVGLQRGDIIAKIDGHDIRQAADTRYRFGTRDIGGKMRIDYIRPGTAPSKKRRFTAELVLIAPPETPPRNVTQLEGGHPFAGSKTANINPALADELRLASGLSGVIILATEARSPARRRGFRTGDIIRTVNDKQISSVRDLRAALARRVSTWVVEIERNGRAIRTIIR